VSFVLSLVDYHCPILYGGRSFFRQVCLNALHSFVVVSVASSFLLYLFRYADLSSVPSRQFVLSGLRHVPLLAHLVISVCIYVCIGVEYLGRCFFSFAFRYICSIYIYRERERDVHSFLELFTFIRLLDHSSVVPYILYVCIGLCLYYICRSLVLQVFMYDAIY